VVDVVSMSKALTFVTSNRHKFKEAERIAKEHGVKLRWRNISYAEIQSDNLADIARVGSQLAAMFIRAPCFVEDAGLFIEALRGFPGPYSAYVFKTIGNDGILRLMEGVDNRAAEFRSVVGYCESFSNSPKIFEGRAKGTIALEVRGKGGFGYDPIFLPHGGDGRTFAEMSTDEKNELSHRGEAIRKLVKWYVEVKEGEGIK